MTWATDWAAALLDVTVIAMALYAAKFFVENRHRFTLKGGVYDLPLLLGVLAAVVLLHVLDLLSLHISPQAAFFDLTRFHHPDFHRFISFFSVSAIALGMVVVIRGVRILAETIEDTQRGFRAFFDNVPISLSLKDAQGRYLLVNRTYEKWLERRSDEIVGKTVAAFVDDSGLLAALREAERLVLETGRMHELEVRVTAVNGRVRDRLVLKFPIWSSCGAVSGIGTVGMDTTSRREAEDALKKSESRFRDFAESSADWFWEMDENLRFTFMSPNVEQIVGVPAEWYYGKTRADLLGDDYDRDLWERHLAAMEARRSFRDFVYRRAGDGIEPKWLRVSGKPVFGDDGEFLGYRGSGRDVTEFMAARARVDRAESLLRDAIEGIADSVTLYDADERYILSNSKFLDFYPSAKPVLRPGTKRADIARRIYESRDIRNAEEEFEKWRRRRRKPSAWEPEINEQQLADGRWVFAQEHATLNGNTVIIRTDVTALKQREIALRESEGRFRAFIDNAPMTILIKDVQGRYIAANKRWHDVFNPNRTEAKGRPVVDFYPEALATAVDALDRKVLRSGVPLEAELQTPMPDGQVRTTLTQKFPVLDHDGEIAAIGSFNTDITERKRAEKAQRQSERRVAEIFDASPAMIMVSDYKTGTLLEANAAAPSTLGYSLDEMLGETTLELGIWRTPDERAALMAQLDRHGVVRNHELVFYTKDRDEVPLLFSGAKIESDGDAQVLGVMTNIAEWKALEDRLRQSQKMEAVGRLTGGLAHDFNNLLGVIIGNLDFLEEALCENRDLLGLVAAASKAAVTGAELNKRLLAFSRTQPLAPKVVDLNARVADMLAVLQRTLGETIVVETIQNESLWRCDVDPAQVETALLNLALNARDAMREGGKLTIETDNVRLDDDYAAAQTEVTPGAYVRLTVTDTGEGMPPDVLGRVFEPFFTTKGVGEGSGLGLSMVFGFAKQSGGHVTMQSEEGVGTAVTLYLPRSRLPAAAEDTSPDMPQPAGGTVLLVEDDPDLRMLATTMLDGMGYEVLAAQDGRSALALIDGAKGIDLLLTDVVLPGGMSGPAIAEAAVKRQEHIKVLFMSGYTEDTAVLQARIGDRHQLLQKPFRKVDLARRIETVLTDRS